MSEKNDGFLSRWSRRKRVGGAAPVVDAPAEPSAATPAQGEGTEATPETPETLERGDQTPADLPDIDSLDKDSDYTVFLKKGVPEELKTLALRKLWRSDPVFAWIDGLDDYDENYRAILAAGTKLIDKARAAGVKLAMPGDETAPEGEGADQRAGPPADDSEAAAQVAGEENGGSPEGEAGEAADAPASTPRKAARKAAKSAAGKATGKAARKPAKKATGKAAGRRAGKRAGKQAGKRAGKPARKPA